MRSAWIRKNFPGTHVAQIRDPLPQWDSFSIQPFFRNTLIKIALDLRRTCPACFSHIPNFDRFAEALDKRRSLPADQLYEFFLKQDDFLALFILVWVLSALQSISFSHLTLDVDRLTDDGVYRASVQEWFAALGCDLDLADCSIPKTTQVDPGQADAMAIEAGRAFKRGACPILLYDPAALASARPVMSDRSRNTIDLFLTGS